MKSWRPIDGVLLLDKPEGLSSNSALQQARRIYQAEKAGHTGTLDPFATGLLPIAFGEATKLSHFALDADKTYEATMRLGITTTTGDPEGEVLNNSDAWQSLTRREVEAVLLSFVGEQQQCPPMYSALKYEGRPYYEYARAGISIPRPQRHINILSLSLNDCALPLISFTTQVSKGTYIRTLAEDIGKALGCGAHLTSLRRIATGSFSIGKSYSLETLRAADAKTLNEYLLPIDVLVSQLPRVELDQSLAARWRQGQRLSLREVGLDLATHIEACAVYEGTTIIGIGMASDGALRPKRILVR